VTQQYLDFINRATAVSRAFYPNNATAPALNYFVQMMPSSGIERFDLMLDGKSMRGGPAPGQAQEFVWRGQGGVTSLTARAKEEPKPLNLLGPWALFRFLLIANNQPVGSGNVYDYHVVGQVSVGRPPTATNPPQGILRLRIDARDAPGVFNSVFGLTCIPKIAQ
jgi:type VI protein secretion system component VasK